MIIEDFHLFDGKQLKERFALNTFGQTRTLAIGNIISFVGPLSYRVKDKFISAEQCINFCVELPRFDPLAGVLFNKLFITNVGQILTTDFLKKPIEVSQNTLIVEDKHIHGGVEQKNGIVSVNLYSSIGDTFMIYLGLYNKAGDGANVRAYSMNLDSVVGTKLMEQVNQSFYFLSNDTFLSTCHVI